MEWMLGGIGEFSARTPFEAWKLVPAVAKTLRKKLKP